MLLAMNRARSFVLRRYRFTVVVALLVVIWTGGWIVWHRNYLFRNGPQGGLVGRKLDNTIKSLLFVWRDRAYRQDFCNTFGFALPKIERQQTGVPVLLHTYLSESLYRAKQRHDLQENIETLCPQCIISPLVGAWYTSSKASNGALDHFTVLPFQESELDDWMFRQGHEVLLEMYQNFKDKKDKVQLASLLLTLSYGGVFVGSQYKEAPQDYYREDETDSSVLILEVDSYDILYLRAIRDLGCAIQELALIVQKGFSSWQIFLQSFRDACESAKCCRDTPLRIEFAKSPSNNQPQDTVPGITNISPATSTEVNWSIKQSKRQELDRQRCRAGWLCHRCLRLPWRGSIQACQLFCNSCYVKVIGDPLPPVQQELVFDIVKPDTASTRIPRVIHQTWFEDVSTSTYPHLTRLQNSWKAMPGWEYRFYTDDDARGYIETHYPNLFVNAYDALIPGAFKADLFRLLVLLREGGVYADIDVQLDTDLDSFLAADISFFVPRDCPLDRWPNSNFCLWNGFMGSLPGHPILLQAVEDVMNHALNRMDYYDLEGALFQKDIGAEVWKLRSIPILLLTGPCALGTSVNKAAKIPNVLRGFPVGWLPEMKGVLMLNTDRYDLGELRFTDLDRNILVASTNADALSREAIRHNLTSSSKKESVHYSKSESEIVGEHGVYKDDQTANKRIRLQYKIL
eukprot:scaffold17318_cov169-Amphora_coffeaeformis.AAC.7